MTEPTGDAGQPPLNPVPPLIPVPPLPTDTPLPVIPAPQEPVAMPETPTPETPAEAPMAAPEPGYAAPAALGHAAPEIHAAPAQGTPAYSPSGYAAPEAQATPAYGTPAYGTPTAQYVAQVPESPAPAPRRKRRWVAATLITLAILGLLGLAGLSTYLIYGINDWRTYAADVETSLESVRKTAAVDRADRKAAEERIATLEEQVANATARITELANEEANALDSHDILKTYVDAMIECADARQELIDVLTSSSLYYPGKTNSQVEREYTEYCDAIVDDYETYLAGK